MFNQIVEVYQHEVMQCIHMFEPVRTLNMQLLSHVRDDPIPHRLSLAILGDIADFLEEVEYSDAAEHHHQLQLELMHGLLESLRVYVDQEEADKEVLGQKRKVTPSSPASGQPWVEEICQKIFELLNQSQ